MVVKTDDGMVIAHQNKRLEKNHSGGLRSPGLLGQHPLIGLIMVVLGGSLFILLALNLQTHGPLLELDTQIATDFHTLALQSYPLMQNIMIFGFFLAEYGFIVIGAALVLYFLYKRFWTELGMVLIAWGGEGPMWFFLSDYFHRARPPFTPRIWQPMASPGFPSGHSIAAVMCFGLLAYLVMPHIKSGFWKVVLIIVTLLAILYIGYSRLFVSDHYPTDILAGYALGLAWSGLVYTSVEWIARRRKLRKQI
jgi:undecaprenyl-diphosphatase